MYRFIQLSGYEMMTAFFPFLAMFFVFFLRYKNKGVPIPSIRIAFLFIFAVYLTGVLYLTGPGTLFDALVYQLEWDQGRINLIPLINGIDIPDLLNILLFIPLGFLLPFLDRQMRKCKNIFWLGASLSLFIEISQLLNNRRTDIDDFIFNTLGAVLGFLIYKCLSPVLKINTDSYRYMKYEPIFYITVLFLGHFFLFNRSGMADLLYKP